YAAPWDEDRVRSFVAEVVVDAERAFDPVSLWQDHPLDDALMPGPRTSVYAGAAGVCCALDHLCCVGFASTTRNWRQAAQSLIPIYRRRPDTGAAVPSLFLGEVGLLAVADVEHERMASLIESNIENPALEPLWGSPGTMLPALFMLRRTNDG